MSNEEDTIIGILPPQQAEKKEPAARAPDMVEPELLARATHGEFSPINTPSAGADSAPKIDEEAMRNAVQVALMSAINSTGFGLRRDGSSAVRADITEAISDIRGNKDITELLADLQALKTDDNSPVKTEATTAKDDSQAQQDTRGILAALFGLGTDPVNDAVEPMRRSGIATLIRTVEQFAAVESGLSTTNKQPSEGHILTQA